MSFRLVPLIKGTAPLIVLQRPVLLIGRHSSVMSASSRRRFRAGIVAWQWLMIAC